MNSSDPENPNMPSKRWGHTSVEALNRMFIIGGYQGQYLGDIWMHDFRQLRYTKLQIESTLANPSLQEAEEVRQLLFRSNHTSVFYKPHNSIYVFGGGQAQKRRFNDTLRIQLPSIERGQQFMDGSLLARMGFE